VEEEAQKMEKKARIGIRINPVVKTGTLDVWETAIEESKFGITLSKGIKAYKKAQKSSYLNIEGIQTHIGSQIENFKPYQVATERIMNFMGELKKTLDITLQVVDMGGGIAVPFAYADVPPLEKYAHAMIDPFKKSLEEHDLGEPTLIIEPGGRIVGNTTILLLTVGMVKREESSKKWAMVDGGANVNLRATQGWYVFQCFCCNKMNEKMEETINVAGPLCYAGDVLAYDRELPHLEEGDILALLDCGAYTAAIINRYNSYPAPAMVLVQEGTPQVIKQGETLTDLTTGEVIHAHL
jgi:diaminopimelate decarboxylase